VAKFLVATAAIAKTTMPAKANDVTFFVLMKFSSRERLCWY